MNSSPPMRAMRPRVAERLLEALRHVAQHAVADVVAERVVDLLEAAQVEHEQRQRSAATDRRRAHASRCVEQRGAVRAAMVSESCVAWCCRRRLLRAALADVAHDGGVQALRC